MDKQSRTDPYRLPAVYYGGVDTLAVECFPNMSKRNARRAVFRALAELEQAGLVKRVGNPKPGEQQIYQITMPGMPVDN